MSYIAPNTTVVVCKGVPLDNTYRNTLYWASVFNQMVYFASKSKYTYEKQTYQRVEKNKIRVQQNAEDLYDCNYMYFCNQAFGSKVFYAFITGVEYINNVTSEITYEIDVMQTWHFSYELGYCFVEREHSSTDEIGDNIVAEPLEVGEYLTSDYTELSLDSASGGTTSIADGMFVVVTADDNPPVQCIIGNTVASLQYYGFTGTLAGSAGVLSAVSSAVSSGDIDKIVSIYVAPRCLCSGSLSSAGTLLSNSNYVGANTLIHTEDALTGDEYFGSYQPRNKKLYTYPYNYFKVDNSSGSELTLRYEFFTNNQVVLGFFGTFLKPASISCFPRNYAVSGESTSSYPLYGTNISLTQYPECPYSGDLYKEWVAANAVPVVLGTEGHAMTSYTLSGDKGMALSLARSAADTISEAYKAKVGANLVRGQVANGAAAFNAGVQNFYGGRVHITEQECRIIDDFFTMYGYQVNRVKQPNRTSREKWNYVKTQGCIILPESVPADDVAKIEQIYDNGVTFWHSASYVGHYNLTNEIA